MSKHGVEKDRKGRSVTFLQLGGWSQCDPHLAGWLDGRGDPSWLVNFHNNQGVRNEISGSLNARRDAGHARVPGEPIRDGNKKKIMSVKRTSGGTSGKTLLSGLRYKGCTR